MPQFERAIGPLWSDWGLKAWNLLLGKEEIIAHPYSTWETLRLALGMQLRFLADPGRAWRENPGAAPLHGARPFRHYVVRELRSITVTVNHTANQIDILHAGGTRDLYDIQHRASTSHIMTVLREMYPHLYHESGVPKSAAARLLKT